MRFEWDPAKAEENRKKHGVTFEEATALFVDDANCLEIFDEEHSDEEDRFIALGAIKRGVLVVVYTEPMSCGSSVRAWRRRRSGNSSSNSKRDIRLSSSRQGLPN